MEIDISECKEEKPFNTANMGCHSSKASVFFVFD